MYQFINDDNLNYLPGCIDKQFDLAVLDPEYGIGESGKNHKQRNTLVRQSDGKTMRRARSTDYVRSNWDELPPSYKYFKEIFRTSTNQIIFGANYFTEIVGTVFKPPRRADFDAFIKRYPNGWIIWDKLNGTTDFNDCELVWTSFNRPSVIFQFMWNGFMQGKSLKEPHIMQGNKKLNEVRIHCTQKPIPLYYWLYQNYADKNTSILDANIGSGSSAIAADKFGINSFLGIEKDGDMLKKAVNRFHNYKGLFNAA